MKCLSRFLVFAFAVALVSTATAADYQCKGDDVVKSGSTQYRIRWSGSDFSVEKSGSTVGWAKDRSGKVHIEVSGSTQATIEGDKIVKSGSTWASVSEAKQTYDCPDHVAAALWVLSKLGKL